MPINRCKTAGLASPYIGGSNRICARSLFTARIDRVIRLRRGHNVTRLHDERTLTPVLKSRGLISLKRPGSLRMLAPGATAASANIEQCLKVMAVVTTTDVYC